MELLLALPKTACRAERSDRAGLVGLAPGHEVPTCQAFRAPSLDSLGDAEMEGASVAFGLTQQTHKIIWLGKEGRASFRVIDDDEKHHVPSAYHGPGRVLNT